MADSLSQAGMHVEWWPVTRPKPYPRNARKLTQKAIEKVALSIKEFGWRQPIVCDAHDTIVIGHLRLASAQWLKLDTVPVHVASELSPAKIRALRLMDNRSHEEFVWDEDLLREEMVDLQALGDLDLSLSGFDARELDALLIQPDDNADDCPDVPVAPVSRTGDLWLMGEHRLLCGDATKAEDVARLMDGCKADMVFTDPPYGVDFVGAKYNPYAKAWAGIANDEKGGAALANFLEAVFGNVVAACIPAAAVYVWGASMQEGYETLKAMRAAGIHVQSQVVWVKNALVLGQADYQWKHEICWYGWTNGTHHYWSGGRALTTVWEHAKDANAAYTHPMQKPVSLAVFACENSCREDGSVLDVFGGSGSTLIACEKGRRNARMLEIEPLYCDVIVTRWQNFTHREATLAGHGATFAQVKEGRLREWEDNVKEECLEMLDNRLKPEHSV